MWPTGFEQKTTHKAMRSPTLRDLEWAAGFVEGEGNFRYYNSANVSASQVNPEPIAKLLELFGGKATRRKCGGKNSNAEHIWVWSVYGARARGVMMTLYPLLSARRQNEISAILNGA